VLKLGRRGDTLIEVLSGLSAGDTVVANGNLLIDGQAEMNRAFAEPASTSKTTNAPSSTLPALTGAQRQAVRDFLALADAITDALAADDLDAFNAQAAKTPAATPALLAAFAKDNPWQALLKPFESAGHLSGADDLKAARKAFYPFSTATVALAQALRRGEKEFAALKVFRCPMTGDAFPGAPNRADWMQTRPAVRNPYFGAEMLECGAEVKP
jgi:Cu(I)/Ag(I) efflux system membrane fusion protein